MHPRDLERQSRAELIARAELLGIEKASLLTRAELTDEIVRRMVNDPVERRIARGLLGLARDLVASVVERGLHLPEAAAKIRSIPFQSHVPSVKPPIATVTLAEIYAAQGHRFKALRVLGEVLAKEPDHTAARQLRDSIAASGPDDPVIAPESDELPLRRDEMAQPVARVEAPPPAEALTAEGEDGPRAEPAERESAVFELYESDEVVLIPVDQATIFVYWELRHRTQAEARAAHPDGTLVLRLLAVSASFRGPVVETRDLETEQTAGEWLVRDLPFGAVLRAALGWRTPSHFLPLAVAMHTHAPASDSAPSPTAENGGRVPARTRTGERASERVTRAAAQQGSASWVELPLTLDTEPYRAAAAS